MVNHQKTYAAVVGQKPLTQPNNSQTFQFTTEQLTQFVANVVIQTWGVHSQQMPGTEVPFGWVAIFELVYRDGF